MKLQHDQENLKKKRFFSATYRCRELEFTTTLQGACQQAVGNGTGAEAASLHLETQLEDREADGEKETEKTERGKDGGRDGSGKKELTGNDVGF